MTDQFQQKAQKLISKLSALQPSSILHSRKHDHSLPQKTSTSNSSFSLHEFHKFQEEVQHADQDNKRKIKILNEEVSKLQSYLLQENQARNKISQNFVTTATKVQKNMKITLQNITKSFQDKEHKLQNKIEQILKSQQRELESHATENESLIEELTAQSKSLTRLEEELQEMKKSRYLLEEKIYKQFIEQIKELRKIYERDLKEREERENQLVECLKGVYTSLMEQVKKEQLERQQNEKGFLTVVEQVIARIVDY